ncbi:hypothetical protein L1987_20084 [Smallanthus sonchifolius]|uniref:Uncharacterized protein n=1 Tax=Smallanthus sonchifolius TaxID=185202 RepID=A0ACB9IRA2_9ASTR|nr:hypothetical protein L1987_20084 [Smallanthus sonchifolius]
MWCVFPNTSEVDIKNLPKYIFEVSNGDVGQPDVRACKMMPMGTNSPNFSTGCVLPTKDVGAKEFSNDKKFIYVFKSSKAEELPECILCCLQLKEITYNNYNSKAVFDFKTLNYFHYF